MMVTVQWRQFLSAPGDPSLIASQDLVHGGGTVLRSLASIYLGALLTLVSFVCLFVCLFV